jgi:hypothetical protein
MIALILWAQLNTPIPPDICTAPHAYIDVCQNWRLAWPGQNYSPETTQSVCEHARMAHDPYDGKWYHIVGQGVGGSRWPRPPSTAAYATDRWNDCYINHNTSGNFPECLHAPPAGTQNLPLVPISSPIIPAPIRNAWMNQFHCNNPTPTPTPAPSGAINADWIEQFAREGFTAGCQANPPLYCPDNPVTRAQIAIFILKAVHGTSYVPPKCSGMFNDVPCPIP